MQKPFSAACERNQAAILSAISPLLSHARSVLEIGSGTGQHAVHFAERLPHLQWQSSDRPEYLAGIQQWLAEAGLPNTPRPLVLDVDNPPIGLGPYDAIYTANTLHIMSWPQVQQFFNYAASVLTAAGHLVVYGPFNYNGQFTSPSNARFDADLRQVAAHMGIRDCLAVQAVALGLGLELRHDYAMPANNRCLVWQSASVPHQKS